MQSELTGHIGGKGNHFCCKCEVGGTQKEKAENEGYHALFEGPIIEELQKQIKLACSGVVSQHWIDSLISRFKELKWDDPDRTDEDIQDELVQWTVDNEEKMYSSFLFTMKGG
ncbi:hypothetical protein GGX14DRAFT_407416 [Mycena pura]|uniref:Uncharacterized protein n=1 Tax=Mycena pura TaxID=153505 RepID=A0AAD6Y4F1_9AGAR|nr:hypothetical protein GGX14DRAFT_407416 [Mycena pura]